MPQHYFSIGVFFCPIKSVGGTFLALKVLLSVQLAFVFLVWGRGECHYEPIAQVPIVSVGNYQNEIRHGKPE
jgi:hypothetical protein